MLAGPLNALSLDPATIEEYVLGEHITAILPALLWIADEQRAPRLREPEIAAGVGTNENHRRDGRTPEETETPNLEEEGLTMRTAKKPRAKKRKPFVITEHGVHIRLFKRGANWWYDIRRGGRRDRKPCKTTDRETAEDIVRAIAAEVARQDLLGVKPDTLTLGQLFAAYRESKGKMLEGSWKKGAESRQRLFLGAWGPSLPVISISHSNVDGYATTRRADYVAQQLAARTAKAEQRRALEAKYTNRTRIGRPVTKKAPDAFSPRPLRDGALDGDFRWLSSVLNWATRHKLADGKRLLTINPLHDCEWPREQNVRRPIASHERYVATMEHVDAVDPRGRLGMTLTLARYTARRIDAILQLRESDFLLTTDRVRAALAAAGQDEGLAAHMRHGAIRWRAEHDKKRVERITPISGHVRAELDRYFLDRAIDGALPVTETPAFPAVEEPSKPLSRSSATKWLRTAEARASQPKLADSLWHAYRRLWSTERKHLPDVDVAEAGGWNGTKAMKLSYQQATPAGVLAAVKNA